MYFSYGYTYASYQSNGSHVRLVRSGQPFAAFGVLSPALSVSTSGNGTIASVPSGIACGSICFARFAEGTLVTLSPTPAEGHSFSGWTGACTGTGACNVRMDGDKSVSAVFTVVKHTLTTARTGEGIITSQPAGIDCGSTCRASFSSGTAVTLSAAAGIGHTFSGWTGACTGTGACNVTMDGDKSAAAFFTELPKYAVVIKKPATGLVESDPAGILCGGRRKQCVADFSDATLTATPDAGYEFVRWLGCPSAQGDVCRLSPTGKMTLQAIFKKRPVYTLKVTKDQRGAVISSPAGLKCPDRMKSCSVKFVSGTEVTLIPVPQSGRTFAGWTGACAGTDLCTLRMDGNRAVGATFQ